MKLCLASGNAHKAREFQRLADAGPLRGALQIVSAREACGAMPPVAEDTGAFIGNARKKARALWEKLRGTASGTGCQPVEDLRGTGCQPVEGLRGTGCQPVEGLRDMGCQPMQTSPPPASPLGTPGFLSADGAKRRPTRQVETWRSQIPNPPPASPCHSRHSPAWWVISDDSGLCVDALDGAPGVESAYYAGPQADSAANLAKLARVMRDVPDENRAAHFVCVLVLISPGGEERIFEGRCAGRLARAPRGAGGFGYDPLFVPDGHAKTFAELGESEKNTLSHRARAWRQAGAFLATLNLRQEQHPRPAP